MAPVLVEIEEERHHTPFLCVADDSNVRERIVVELSMTIGYGVRDALDNFCPLLAQRDIIKINLRVCRHKEIEVITEHE